MPGAYSVARRELRDQLRDWRILAPIAVLTLFFPVLMNFTAQRAVEFVERYGADIIGERLVPFLLMVVGFFPISISLVIALESFAGERERLSLEPLLATPLTDSQLYFGKIAASLITPLGAAFLGIFVYLGGLLLRIGWRPPPQLLLQVLLLTGAQAMVMVTGAVVISSQTTSVRAANLLASFIIVPVSQLIIGESLIMFWGRYHILWWIVVALVLISIVLVRMGLHLFNREELLGRDFDTLDLRWAWRVFWNEFVGGARNLRGWYRGLLNKTVPQLRWAAGIMVVALLVAYGIGFRLARDFTLPAEMFQVEGIPEALGQEFSRLDLGSGSGWLWVVSNNLRAMVISSVLGTFSFGVMSVILLMAPLGIVGYFAGNFALAGHDAGRLLLGLVVPHGVLEVPAAVLAGAAILQLGLAALSLPKGSSLGESWLLALANWARVLLGLVVPLLLGAAALEVYLTPWIALQLFSGS
jgi:hypothetical protein